MAGNETLVDGTIHAVALDSNNRKRNIVIVIVVESEQSSWSLKRVGGSWRFLDFVLIVLWRLAEMSLFLRYRRWYVTVGALVAIDDTII